MKFNKILKVMICCAFAVLSLSTLMIPQTKAQASDKVDTVTLYDGSVVTTSLISVNTDEVTMTVKGFSSSVKTLKDVVVNNKTYNVSTSSGGASSTGKYIKLESTMPFKVIVVASSGNSSQTIIGVGSAEKTSDTDKIVVTANTAYTYGRSEQLDAGTYFLTFNNNTNIAEISVEFVSNGDEQGTLSPIINNDNAFSRTDFIKMITGVSGLLLLVFAVIYIFIAVSNKKKN